MGGSSKRAGIPP